MAHTVRPGTLAKVTLLKPGRTHAVSFHNLTSSYIADATMQALDAEAMLLDNASVDVERDVATKPATLRCASASYQASVCPLPDDRRAAEPLECWIVRGRPD